MMRVSAGQAKGRKLDVPRSGRVRPTQDRVREAIFNALGEAVLDARVLDLFAGAGGLGIEALSRGAAHAVFVEQDARTARMLRANVERLGLRPRAEVWQAPAARAVLDLHTRGARFDLVLMDPPYRTRLAQTTLDAVCAASILADSAVVVVETYARDPVGAPPGTSKVRERRYGDTLVAFVRRDPALMD
jgi:16S rRNA (guanine(966)-N(2))-methyltransferase RsmD